MIKKFIVPFLASAADAKYSGKVNPLFIILLILLLIIISISLLITQKKEEPTKPLPRPPTPPKPKPKKEYVYLSVFTEYLKRYNLPQEKENSFFDLRKCILDDGYFSAQEKIKNIINQNSMDISEKVSKLLFEYEKMKNTEDILQLPKWTENKATPKIYKDAVKNWLKNFNLEKLAEENVEDAMFKVLEKLYDEGKRQFLRKLETNIEWLQNYQLQQDLEAMEKEIGRIVDKLK